MRGDLAALLRPYEDRADRAALRRIRALEERLVERGRSDEVVSRAQYRMELVSLTKVELAASTHVPGPLFYGVYPTPPTEIVVERSDGSVLCTESLAAKATEETEFCEGYAER